MRRRRVVAMVAGAAAVWGAGPLAVAGAVSAGVVPAGPGAVAAAARWGKAVEVPGLGALNKGGEAGTGSVSCASAGNCAAGGFYTDRRGHGQGFVASEEKGRWGQAIEVPGLGRLNTGGDVLDLRVSCGSAGNCAAGGSYKDRAAGFHFQAFVASQDNGRWGQAVEVPGLGALNTGGFADVSALSCTPRRACAAGGSYEVRHGVVQGFVVTARNGRWGRARPVPGLAALNAGGVAEVTSLSCASAGNCAAGGNYRDASGHQQGFVVSEASGRWGQAIEVPGLAALNAGGGADAAAMSCASAGDCVAGGDYADREGNIQGFVVSEKNGTWGTATPVPGLADLNTGGDGVIDSLSCPSAGNCAAGGIYATVSGMPFYQGFVVSEKNGHWDTAIEVPGLGTLNQGEDVERVSVSCGLAGNCVAGGDYLDGDHGHFQGFVAGESNGRWGTAIQVPGLRALNAGGSAHVSSVSCPAPGHCAAGGSYRDRSGHDQGFVASQT